MKKKLFFGVALMGIAFSGAAFTANRALQANHYIQKANSCDPIPTINCIVVAPNACDENDGTGDWPVYQSQNPSNLDQCRTKLFRPTNP